MALMSPDLRARTATRTQTARKPRNTRRQITSVQDLEFRKLCRLLMEEDITHLVFTIGDGLGLAAWSL